MPRNRAFSCAIASHVPALASARRGHRFTAMMTRVFSTLLIVALFVLSVQTGIARVHEATGNTITICGGSTIKTITIGLDGTVQETFHACPDAALAGDLPTDAPALRRSGQVWLATDIPRKTVWNLQSAGSIYPSRGPPHLF